MGKKLFAELVGTLALVFCLTSTIVCSGGGIVAIALSLGLTVMVMVYAVGRVSGAHFNPAVTFGMLLARRMSIQAAVPYWVAQCIGAVLGSLLLRVLLPHVDASLSHTIDLGMTLPGGATSDIQALLMEIVLTFFLMFVVLRVADGPKEMSLLAGIAVGAVLAMCVLVGGNISGASMNPARSLGPALVSTNFAHLWIYVVGPLAGAGVAVAADRIIESRKV
jgi:aquaporin Z